MENNLKGDDVIKVALSFLETPFHHQGRLKHIGIDCAGLIVEVMKELSLDVSFDMKAYDRIPDGLKLAQLCSDNGIATSFDKVQTGDVILFNILGNPQHLGFYYKLNGMDYLVHAYGEQSVNKVAIHRLDEKWKKRIVGVFRIKGIE